MAATKKTAAKGAVGKQSGASKKSRVTENKSTAKKSTLKKKSISKAARSIKSTSNAEKTKLAKMYDKISKVSMSPTPLPEPETPRTPSAPSKGISKEADPFVPNDNAFDHDNEEGLPTIPYKSDDSDDSDYVDDSDAEIVEFAIKETKYKRKYGDLEEEGGRYAVLLKNGDWEDEKQHEENDPMHKTCVLDKNDVHTLAEV